MTPSHTPGPWSVHRKGDEFGGPLRRYAIEAPPGDPHNRREVASIYMRRTGAKRGGHPRWIEHADDAANARLIAAAPDLLAALDAVLAHVEDVDGERYPDDESHPAIRAARSALARARGQGACR